LGAVCGKTNIGVIPELQMSFVPAVHFMFYHWTQQAGNKTENNSKLLSFIEQPLMGQ
jgi:hypothetical protein